MKSTLRTALNALGFPEENQHKALIENLYISGILTPQNLWESVTMLGMFANKPKVFSLIVSVLNHAGAFQNNLDHFDVEYILNNLFTEAEFDQQDIYDFILYWGQFAFARKPLQERNDIKRQSWMENEDLRTRYIGNCRILGLVDPIFPDNIALDETWVMGASYPTTKDRLKYLADRIDEDNLQPGKIRLLSGKRELSVGLDTEDGIITLAKKLNIKYNKKSPFVQRADGKTYLNYSISETRRLYESDMMQDQAAQILNQGGVELIDSEVVLGKGRPDTVITAVDAANALIYRIQHGDLRGKKEINILICSNQPYIERQYLAAKRVVEELLRKNKINVTVNVHRSGYGMSDEVCHKKINVLHSDGLGVYTNELYKNVTHAPKRPMSYLLYQSREKTKEMVNFLSSKSFCTTTLAASIAINVVLNTIILLNFITCSLLFLASTTLIGATNIALNKSLEGLSIIWDLALKEGPVSFVQRIKDAAMEHNIPAIPAMAY